MTQRTEIASRKSSRDVWISIGSNLSGAWNKPLQAVQNSLLMVEEMGLHVKVVSDYYVTRPIGGGRQLPFVNAVACVSGNMPPARMLHAFKQLERLAGRRLGRHWGPRPLDLDILDAGVVFGKPSRGRRRAGQLILPHPELHKRAFVLVPLAQIAPHWRHPSLDRGLRALLNDPAVKIQLQGVRRGGALTMPSAPR